MFQDVARFIVRQAGRSGVPAHKVPDFSKIEIVFVDTATAIKDGKATVLAVRDGKSITLDEKDSVDTSVVTS